MMSRSNTVILLLAIVAAAIGGFWQMRMQVPPQQPSPMVGKMAPDLALTGLDGQPTDLAAYRGRPMLLNFWATWCGPCIEEMPALDQAHTKFGEQAAIVVGIAMDDRDRVQHFLASRPVTYPIVLGQMDPPSSSLQLGNTMETLPYNVLIGADGIIKATHAGALTPAQIERWMRESMAQPETN